MAMASHLILSWACQGSSVGSIESYWCPFTWENNTSASRRLRVSTICISMSISEDRNFLGFRYLVLRAASMR